MPKEKGQMRWWNTPMQQLSRTKARVQIQRDHKKGERKRRDDDDDVYISLMIDLTLHMI